MLKEGVNKKKKWENYHSSVGTPLPPLKWENYSFLYLIYVFWRYLPQSLGVPLILGVLIIARNIK